MSDPRQCVEETARVVEVDGAWVWVEARAKSACEACKVKGNCASQALSSVMTSNKALKIKVPNTFEAQLNEEIVIGWGRGNFLKSVARVYLLPSLTGVMFAIAGSFYSEGAAALSGLIGMSAALAYLGMSPKAKAQNDNPEIIFLRRTKENTYG